MKRLLLFLLLALGLSVGASAQTPATLTAAASTCNFTSSACLVVSVSQTYGAATFTITSNAGGNTIQFEASGDGTQSWVSLSVTPSNSTTTVTSTTSTGTWQANIAGYTHIRMRMSTQAGGNTNVQITPSQASARAGGGGGGGTVTSVSGTANQIDVATGTTTPVISIDSALQLPGTLSMAQNGALSQAAFTMSGTPITGGSGTTTFPLIYYNAGTAPTTWSTSGTYLGVNAPSGFVGNFFDFHVNGGTTQANLNNLGTLTLAGSLSAGGNVLAAAGNQLGFTGRSLFTSSADGIIRATNNAGTGFSRLILGSDTTAFPALCPNTATTPMLTIGVGGANCTTTTFIKTAQTLLVTAADVTCGTGGTLAPCTSFTTITGLSATLPLIATNWSFECNLIVGQATAAAADQIGVQTATNASTNLAASGIAYTAAATSTAAAFTTVSSTTAQSIVTFTPGATGTKLPVYVKGTIEGTSASGTVFNLQVLTGAAADLLTVYRGSACWLF